MTLFMNGCKDLNATLPTGTPDPSIFNTPAGALAKRNATDSLFIQAFQQYVFDTGLLTDELEDARTGGAAIFTNNAVVSLDERILPEQISDADGNGHRSYENLQAVRGSTNEVIGALAMYDSAASPALRGEMYALQGYAEVMLGELFCSGVPLSTFDFQGDFTYRPGSTQQQVYTDAIIKFDSALALSDDSTRIKNIARVGLGRAYLDLGDYVHAAAAVDSVPDDYRYQLNVQWAVGKNGGNALNIVATVSNREGTNGLPFITSGDPRTRDTASVKANGSGVQLYFPLKYVSGLRAPYYSQMTLADGVEARLIQSEAALNAGDPDWLTILNTLRSNEGVSGLAPLSDPGAGLSGSAATAARVDLLFQERAYWLYLTGHRQGDLRRLVRQYHRDQSTVYPVGLYLAPGQGIYGSDVNAPIPSSELPNPYFHGCLDRNA
jgi:hypothetical protein